MRSVWPRRGVQSKLLTLLEDKLVRRLGDTRSIRVDLRVIAATNADLRQLIAQHAFREDLFYRLNVASIHLQPLRERPADIPLLAQHFVEVFSSKYAKAISGLDEAAARCLMEYRYPGNVRELEHIIEQGRIHFNDLELSAPPEDEKADFLGRQAQAAIARYAGRPELAAKENPVLFNFSPRPDPGKQPEK